MKYGVRALAVAAVMSFASGVSAAESDIFKVNGQYAQTGYTYSNGSWVAAGVAVDGVGTAASAVLYYSVYNYSTGYYAYWRNNIPADAVTVNGVNSMSVNLDTCSVAATAGCGPVSFIIDTVEPASGWVNSGVWGYEYGDYIYRAAGASQVRSAAATGSILGVDFSSGGAFIGSVDDVTVEITTGQ